MEAKKRVDPVAAVLIVSGAVLCVSALAAVYLPAGVFAAGMVLFLAGWCGR